MTERQTTSRATPAEAMLHQLIGMIPHNEELGTETIHATRGMAIMRLPYDAKLIGNPDDGVVHGGAVTTLIDSVCGLAVLTAPAQPRRIVTLDLRIDYLRPATPRHDLFARAEVYKLARDIAFVRATAYQDDLQDLVASATGTFMYVGNIQPKDGDVA